MVTQCSQHESENMVSAAATGLVMQFTVLPFVNDYGNSIITYASNWNTFVFLN